MSQGQRLFLSRRDILVLAAAIMLVAAASLLAFLYLDSRFESILRARQSAVVDSEVRYFQLIEREEGREALVRAVARRADIANDDLPLHALIDAEGNYLAGDVDWPSGIVADGQWRPIETNRRSDGTRITGHGRAVQLADGARVLVGRDRSAQRSVQSALGEAMMLALVVLLAVASVLVVALNRRVLHHIDAIVSTARRITAGQISQRIPVSPSADEFGQLRGTLNEMLDRNELHIRQMQLVTDAIAHDLRLPLQRVKADLERARQADGDAVRETMLDRAEGEIDEALATFNALIEITRAESGIGRESFEDVDIARLVEDVVELFEPVAEDKEQVLTHSASPLVVKGQGVLIRQALGNLLQNAIKYCPRGARIDVCANADTAHVLIRVTDNGPGVPGDMVDDVLRPFGRLARDAHAQGKGLGLALVQACAKMHGGFLRLEDAGPGLRATLGLKPAVRGTPISARPRRMRRLRASSAPRRNLPSRRRVLLDTKPR